MSWIEERNSCERRDICIVVAPAPNVLAISMTMTVMASKLNTVEISISIRPNPRWLSKQLGYLLGLKGSPVVLD